jgi:hypothetical protein
MTSGIDLSLGGRVGFSLFVAGILLGWVAVYFNWTMQTDVKRLAPSAATGLRKLYETIDNRRVWREHRRLLPESKTRGRTKVFLILSVTFALIGFVLF